MSHAFVRSKGNQPSSFLVGIFNDLMCKVMSKVTSIYQSKDPLQGGAKEGPILIVPPWFLMLGKHYLQILYEFGFRV